MTEFPHALRRWRHSRRLSQLDLSLEADVSARHISFLETGRAKPSRDMIMRLSEAMHLPLTARNALLQQAGFAAQFQSRSWDHVEMTPIRTAVAHVLDRHAPYPAIVLDREWNITQMNSPAEFLYGLFGLGSGDSLITLLLSDDLPKVVENWPQVAHHTALRLRTESAAQGGVDILDSAAAQLMLTSGPVRYATEAVVPMILRTPQIRLSLFATVAQFGTPEDITLDGLSIELFFPADDESKATLEQLAGATS